MVNVGMYLDCHSHVHVHMCIHSTSVHMEQWWPTPMLALEWLNTNYGCETTVAIGTMYTPGNTASLAQRVHRLFTYTLLYVDAVYSTKIRYWWQRQSCGSYWMLRNRVGTSTINIPPIHLDLLSLHFLWSSHMVCWSTRLPILNILLKVCN